MFADLESCCVPKHVASFAKFLLPPSLGCLGPDRLSFSAASFGEPIVCTTARNICVCDENAISVNEIIIMPDVRQSIDDQNDLDAQSLCSDITHGSMPIPGLGDSSDSGGNSPEVRECFFDTTDSESDDESEKVLDMVRATLTRLLLVPHLFLCFQRPRISKLLE